MALDKIFIEEGQRSYRALLGAVLGAFGVLLLPALMSVRLSLGVYLAAEIGVAIIAALYTSPRGRARVLYAIAFIVVTLGVAFGDTWCGAHLSRTVGALLAFSFVAAIPGTLLMIARRPLTRH